MTPGTTVEERIRPDGTRHIVVKPAPAIYSISAMRGAGVDLAAMVRTLLASGARITLDAAAREELRKRSPEALALLEGGK
ncbi:MAG TPA: hypothetical protein VJP77_05630 [Planctomycetota bacterium]|nr:hypothetical protein [Planctomycetota bacterium]